MGVDWAPNLSKSILVKQYLRPDGSMHTTEEEIMPPTNWVKKNKYAIITIMIKTIADDLRNKYTDLHVEAHPRPVPNSVRLNIRRVETDEGILIDVRPGAPVDMPFQVARQMMTDSNHYTARPELYNKNKVARKNSPSVFTFALDDPQGTTSFETWVDNIVAEWFYAESSEKHQAESVDNTNGSTTP